MLTDLFLLTTVLAGMFALERFVPPGLQLTVRMVVDLFVLVFAITFTGLAAVRLALSCKSFAARLLTLFVAKAHVWARATGKQLTPRAEPIRQGRCRGRMIWFGR